MIIAVIGARQASLFAVECYWPHNWLHFALESTLGNNDDWRAIEFRRCQSDRSLWQWWYPSV